jgi:hypothetical protein
MGGVRLDTGYPFGDSHAAHDNPPSNQTCGGYPTNAHPVPGFDNQTGAHHHDCNPHGTRLGIEQSGIKREAM